MATAKDAVYQFIKSNESQFPIPAPYVTIDGLNISRWHPRGWPKTPLRQYSKVRVSSSSTLLTGMGLPALFELHVWAWQDYPHGAFVDWNTLVTCEKQ
jgi:hypothetical protein